MKCRVLVPLGILQDVEGKLRPLRQGAQNLAPLGPVPGRISSGELARKKSIMARNLLRWRGKFNYGLFRAQNMDVSDMSELAAPLPSSPAVGRSPGVAPSPAPLSELDYR